MIIRRLLHERFAEARWGDVRTIVDIPATGLVVITGDNGSGKSTLIEVVSHALWGKSLRGKVGWRDVKGGSRAGIVTDTGTKITRKREGKRSHVEIIRKGKSDAGDVYDTATKAQHAIDQEFGTFDVWRRSCVFSSSDAAHFSGATDGERKRLLEVVLGLERFDPALAECRDELKGARSRITVCEGEVTAGESLLDVENHRLIEAKNDLAELEEPVPLPKLDEPTPTTTTVEVPAPFDQAKAKALFDASAAIDVRLEEISTDVEGLREEVVEAEKSKAGNQARVASARSNLGTLGDAVKCPTCRQDVSEQHRARLTHGLKTFAESIDEQTMKLDQVIADTRKEITELEAEAKAKRAERDKLQRNIAEARQTTRRHDEAKQRATEAKDRDERANEAMLAEWQRQCAQIDESNAANDERYSVRGITLRTRVREAGERLLDIEDQIDEAGGKLEEARVDVAELEACETALGLMGIRAQVLGRALDGIQAVANLWLERICGADLSLTLKPYSEKKSGKGVTDSISLVLDGAGDGDYLGASGGQRRRFDVALLLALAEVTRAAAGNEPGTCFFDEVFDALDSDGRAAVSDALRELAEDRAVVVITHSADLARSLRGDVYLEAREGKLYAA